MTTSMSGHQRGYRGDSVEWYTPPEIFTALELTFDLDPCSPLAGPVPWIPAERFITADDDGLSSAWNGRAWLNPPYGPETAVWLARLAEHGQGVALVPARTDTRWFHATAPLASGICFLAGRPHFYRPDLTRAPFNSGAPIMLLGFGATCGDAVLNCGLGLCLRGFYRSDSPRSRAA
jgi:hypothetical protein